MARLPRLYHPGRAHHIFQRGNNREFSFYDEANYKPYLSFLKDVADKYQVDIHAFVLMTNYVRMFAPLCRRPGKGSGYQLSYLDHLIFGNSSGPFELKKTYQNGQYCPLRFYT